jgi:DNA repair protein RecO (recombination protein O)
MADPRSSKGPRRRTTCLALVGRRHDFRESSRLVTLFTRELGRLVVLAKGAHRPDSPFLGRLDLFNECLVTLAPDRGGLRLLERVELQQERRALRAPARFLAASHFGELCAAAWPGDRPDSELFDLMQGGIVLLERCPLAAVPVVVLGLELRYLRHLGALPGLGRCGQCGAGLQRGGFRGADGSLTCRAHAPSPRTAISAATLAWLRDLEQLPGVRWPEVDPDSLPKGAAPLCGSWLSTALDWRSRLRLSVFAAPHRPTTGVEVDNPA